MSERLTFSFSHLFELARELSISLDQSGRHSRNDRAVMSQFDDTALERTSSDRPMPKDVFTQCARQRDACLQRAFAHRKSAAPPSDPVRPSGAMDSGFDQGPAEPRRPASRNPAIANPSRAGSDAGHQTGVARQMAGRRKAVERADLRADHQRQHRSEAGNRLQPLRDRIGRGCGQDLAIGVRHFRADGP